MMAGRTLGRLPSAPSLAPFGLSPCGSQAKPLIDYRKEDNGKFPSSRRPHNGN
jgi:hypothetical protein